MRLYGRPVVRERAHATADDVPPLPADEHPLKTEKRLGAISRLRRASRTKPVEPQQARQDTTDRGQKSEPKTLEPMSHTLTTSGGTMQHEDSSLQSPQLAPATPTEGSLKPAIFHRKASSSTVSELRSQPSDSTLRSYYDKARQPLNISQQTSASSARDMALRKGSPMIRDLVKDRSKARRSLPSSVDRSDPKPEAQKSDSEKKRPKKLDLSKVLPQPPPAADSAPQSPCPSPLPTPTPTSHANRKSHSLSFSLHSLSRQRVSKASFESENFSRPRPSTSASHTRAKVFESDVFDGAKTNVRRPPKGIQNWFDGFYISSDEEGPTEEPAQVFELPANEVVYRVSEVSDDPPATSFRGPPTRRPTGWRPTHTAHEDEHANFGLHRTGRPCTADESRRSIRAAEITSDRRGRLAKSRLDVESVLSLSSGSEDEKQEDFPIRDSLVDQSDGSTPNFSVRDAAWVNLRRPGTSPRRLQSSRSRSTMRQDDSYNMEKPSATLFPSTSRDQLLHDRKASRTPPVKRSRSNLSNHRIPGQTETSRSGRRSRTSSSIHDYDRSVIGGALDEFESEACHMMAVTEEEMALLEIMRKRRVKMAKESFTEGYRLALKQEQEQLLWRERLARRTSNQMLDVEDEQSERRPGTGHPTESPPENADNLDRFNSLRREGHDRAERLEKFLTSEVMFNSFPKPPSNVRSVSMPSQQAEYEGTTGPYKRPYTPTRRRPEAGETKAIMTSDYFLDNFVATGIAKTTRQASQFPERRRSRYNEPLLSPIPDDDAPPVPDPSSITRLPSRGSTAIPREDDLAPDESLRASWQPSYRSGPLSDSGDMRHLSESPSYFYTNEPSSIGTDSASPQTPTFPFSAGKPFVDVVGSDSSSALHAFSPEP